MWNGVQSLLIYDVIQEKEKMRFNKTCVILVISLIITVLSLGQKGATQSTAQIIGLWSHLFNKDAHIVKY